MKIRGERVNITLHYSQTKSKVENLMFSLENDLFGIEDTIFLYWLLMPKTLMDICYPFFFPD